mmetsp:Transcript_27858/g.65423  ORF Transcript_27858/g.65423 Transcript_27858/m.65423 type:complete len:117 (-) Transcript_27858:102-452(-)|eukprot:s905_g15.t1
MKRRSQGLRKLHSLWILMGPLRLCSTQADKTSRGVVADPPVRTRPPATLAEVSNPKVDPQVRCSECVRLLRGGYYGHLGVCVPAYPPRQETIAETGMETKGAKLVFATVLMFGSKR